MTAEQKRRAILQTARQNGGTITKKQATELLKHCYYCHAENYVGPILSTLVRCGQLTRIRPGVFELGDKVQIKPGESQTVNQGNLFETKIIITGNLDDAGNKVC